MKRKNVIRAIACGLAAVALAGALVACSSSGSSSSSSTSAAPSASTSTAASTSTSTKSAKLTIFAANSLQKALPEVQALYTKQNPGVTFNDTQFEASGTLVSKLKDAPDSADILICASKATMDTASTNGSIDDSSRYDMFNNDLVICTATGSSIKITSVNDLTTDAITSIAIGEPNAVPAGKYALQTLKSAGLVTYDTADDGTISNIVYADSIANKMNAGADKVGTVAKYVQDGTCQVGFVYTSDIYRYDGITTAFTTPADSHKTIVYPGAVTKASKNADVASDFLKFCTTNADALKIFSNYGFEIASGSSASTSTAK